MKNIEPYIYMTGKQAGRGVLIDNILIVLRTVDPSPSICKACLKHIVPAVLQIVKETK